MYKFNQNDIFFNTITTYPKYNFVFYNNNYYINNNSGSLSYFGTNNVVSASGEWLSYQKYYSNGNVSLLPITYSQSNVTASIQRSFVRKNPASYEYDPYYTTNKAAFKILAASNTINYYKAISQYYDTDYYLNDPAGIEENLPIPNYLPSQTVYLTPKCDVNIIEIPSVFYGRGINPGTIDLQFYITGTLIARAQDVNLNGELIQTTGSTTGNVVGIALYNEGLLLITGSSSLGTATDNYIQPTSSTGTVLTSNPRWIYFGSYANTVSASPIVSSSYIMSFEGTEIVPTLTMLAHANKNDLNWSNNPSYLQSGSFNNYLAVTSSNTYIENSQLSIKNTVSSSFFNYSASFHPQTFINSVGIYDEEGELIAIATVANPVRKTNEQDYTFKLKIDL
jgi:hypothetical protein